jgi:hypothetical protein
VPIQLAWCATLSSVPAPDWDECYPPRPPDPFHEGDLVRSIETGELFSVLFVDWMQWDESPDDHPESEPPINPRGAWEIHLDSAAGAISGPPDRLVKVEDSESEAEARRLGLRR